ncbi:MAG: DUF539 domain-containing protein [Gammaproteobacteria bacterium]
MTLFILTLVLMIAVVAVMAIGVIFGRASLRGSCGGPGAGNCICIKKCAARRRLEMAEKV